MITKFRSNFNAIDQLVTRWMARYGVVMLRVSLGIVFFWFGFLKFFPELSPAEGLAAETISVLTFGIIPPTISVPVLALWEVLIGLGLITGKFMRATIFLLLAQMMGTVTPLFLFPTETFTQFPYAPTLEGQYIIKNVVLVSAALVLGATVRGGDMVADADLAEEGRKRFDSQKGGRVFNATS